MKIVSSFLSEVAGIEVYPLLSMAIFLMFFAGVSWYVFTLDKRFVKDMANLPNTTDNTDE